MNIIYGNEALIQLSKKGNRMNRSLSILMLGLISQYSIISAATITTEEQLSYADVLLKPTRSSIRSRRDVSTKTRLTPKIELSMPVVSASMDSVTDSPMATAMALQGGIGIIHRFNTIEEQAYEVMMVKRFCNTIIENPVTISIDATVAHAKSLMKKHHVSGLLVVDDGKKLVGILTSRDMRFKPTRQMPITQLMSTHLIVGKVDITHKQAKELLQKHKIEKLPLVHADGTIAGLMTSKDIYHKTVYPYSSVDTKGRLLVGAALGVKEDSIDRARALIAAGVDVLVIDIAHGHSDLVVDTLRAVKEQCPGIEIIAGNVATPQGVKDLIEAGADAVKIGIGPASICTTRIVTGCGYPQLSAVMHCAQEADKYDIPIIADGGIRQSGDITKAIAAGASTVMLGNLLAGTDESPGMPFIKRGKKFKVIRGMASFGAKLGREKINGKTSTDYIPEGVEAMVPYKGSVVDIINQLMGGLRSGMSYCGAHTIDALRGKGQFVRITPAGIQESNTHDVHVI